jgi:4a-hydroxytetrahydrobiopterin dehydratase
VPTDKGREATVAVPQLTAAERADALAELLDWAPTADGSGIERTFRFADFSEAWAFMSKVAAIAEQSDHHPEWSNVYNRVSIVLTTHDAGGLSARDVAMARAIDAVR